MTVLWSKRKSFPVTEWQSPVKAMQLTQIKDG